MNFPVSYLDDVVFFYRRHEGNSSRNEELRLTENIRVIEKLLTHYKTTRALLGDKRVTARLAYRYYRLAKRRHKHGRYTEAQDAIRQASLLRPMKLKINFIVFSGHYFSVRFAGNFER